VPAADARHFTRVVDYDLAGNRVVSRGPLPASSESLTHAAIYAVGAGICAVAHVHDSRLWQALQGRVPTTDPAIAYGTPEMAREFARLWHGAGLAEIRIAVMGGHRDGLVSIGANLAEAAGRLLEERPA
jgi:ribulose-5-phosphate 4-epimerase/fuculose-1-phosphate aldolase